MKNRPAASPRKELEPLMTVEDVCIWLHMARGTYYDMRSRGVGPPAFRVGKFLLHKESEVVAWLEARADSAA